MFEDLNLPRVWPIGTILFNLLFFLIAIPIEGYVYHKRLNFDKKTSIFYAIAVNSFSGVIGWIIFFFIEPLLAVPVKAELIGYIFFNNFRANNSQGVLILTTFIIFFATFIMKFFLLRLFIFALSEDFGKKQEEPQPGQRQKVRFISKINFQDTNLVTTTLIANSLSYTAITAILLIRNNR
jgi:hypothetical protein